LDLSNKSLASLPLLRPIFRSFGSFFGSTKTTSVPSHNYGGTGSIPTYGSTPIKRSKAPDAESEEGFAHDGGGISGSELVGSSKTFVMHDITPEDPVIDIEGRQGIYVRNETRVVYHDA
jgi:hypothetical protein